MLRRLALDWVMVSHVEYEQQLCMEWVAARGVDGVEGAYVGRSEGLAKQIWFERADCKPCVVGMKQGPRSRRLTLEPVGQRHKS
ncbi:hypothetical protein L7F22_047150 [Adiantum nelumboides]|nr:hypothetical protein [Adiantum nelumboides]